MQIESRAKTKKKYVVSTFRRDGKLQKRYIGRIGDPAVHLFLEQEKLAKANIQADQIACRQEQEDDLAASEYFKWLCHWSTKWNVINQLRKMKMHTTPTPQTRFRRRLPGLHKFKETCRRAKDGDDHAQRQLDIWIDETPEILSRATNMIAIVQDYLIQFVESNSTEFPTLWQKQVDSNVSEILGDAADDPLSRMCAEVTVLAWLDVMRCSAMLHLATGDRKRSAYWESAMQRSQKRWDHIEKAFRQHMKKATKQPSPKPSTSRRAKNRDRDQ